MRSTEAIEPIPLHDLARWLWLVPLLVLLAYVAGLDQGVITRSGTYVHEFMHDGRHLLAVPCH